MRKTPGKIEALHEVDESSSIARRERISLAHIDVAGDLRRNRTRFEADRSKARKMGEAAAGGFSVGQSVRTKLNNRGSAAPLFGKIAAINGYHITLDNGQTFVATALVAA